MKKLVAVYVKVTSHLQAPVLAALRIYFGWQLFLTGKGKFAHMPNVVEFFTSLGIPFPALNAHFVAGVELVGGILLIAGLAARFAALPIAISMSVAYLTADMDAVKSIFSNPDAFVQAAPFPFLVTALVVLAFGSGVISLDALVAKFAKRRET